MDQMSMEGKKCGCMHHKMTPILVILVGVDFLLGTLGLLAPQAVQIIWPVLLIIGGITKMSEGNCKCC